MSGLKGRLYDGMRLGIIIQARMSSQRLPGKVLKPLGNKPLIQYLIDRVKLINLPWLLATSNQAEDQALADFCKHKGYHCFRGPLENVAARFLYAAEQQKWDAFVRLSGDSPFLDHHLIEAVISLFKQYIPDLATNVFPRSFPKGQSVEVISVESLRKALFKMQLSEDLEHVTPYFYRFSQNYSISNLSSNLNASEIQLSVDTPEDWVNCENRLKAMIKPHWKYSWKTLIKLDESFK